MPSPVFTLTINGKPHKVEVDPSTPLLWVLRDNLGLIGTKFGCGAGLCGACTVHVDGAATRSCLSQVGELSGKAITTIEGLPGADGKPHPVQQAWLDEQVPQCGFCQPGMIMAVAALLKTNPAPTDADIDTNVTNLCRCGTYVRVRKAIHRAAEKRA